MTGICENISQLYGCENSPDGRIVQVVDILYNKCGILINFEVYRNIFETYFEVSINFV
jgi:hypothetical protein